MKDPEFGIDHSILTPPRQVAFLQTQVHGRKRSRHANQSGKVLHLSRKRFSGELSTSSSRSLGWNQKRIRKWKVDRSSHLPPPDMPRMKTLFNRLLGRRLELVLLLLWGQKCNDMMSSTFRVLGLFHQSWIRGNPWKVEAKPNLSSGSPLPPILSENYLDYSISRASIHSEW